MADAFIELTDDNFTAEVKQNGLPVVVDFGRRGVAPARRSVRCWSRWPKVMPEKSILPNVM